MVKKYIWNHKNASQRLVKIHPPVSFILFRKQWFKSSQVAIAMSPGFCLTPMTEGFKDKANIYSCRSGAIRIYQAAMDEKASSDIFYHRGRHSDYIGCGEGLPLDD